MVSRKRGQVHNHDNGILRHPQRVQSTVSTKQFGPVQKTHGNSPTVIPACSLQSGFLIQVMLRPSISVTLMVSTAQIFPFSRFLDLVSTHPVGLSRQVIYRSQGKVKTESCYLKCCLRRKKSTNVHYSSCFTFHVHL
jgi:hypothetical protein